MTILITNQQKHHKVVIKNIRNKAQAILNALEFPNVELSILIVDDAKITEFNRQYLNKDGPTNVISFPMYNGDFFSEMQNNESSTQNPEFFHHSSFILGDVVISVDTAAREGKALGISFSNRFDQLLVHGILHLFGYDHEKSEEEELLMESKSEELLQHIRESNFISTK